MDFPTAGRLQGNLRRSHICRILERYVIAVHGNFLRSLQRSLVDNVPAKGCHAIQGIFRRIKVRKTPLDIRRGKMQAAHIHLSPVPNQNAIGINEEDIGLAAGQRTKNLRLIRPGHHIEIGVCPLEVYRFPFGNGKILPGKQIVGHGTGNIHGIPCRDYCCRLRITTCRHGLCRRHNAECPGHNRRKNPQARPA